MGHLAAWRRNSAFQGFLLKAPGNIRKYGRVRSQINHRNSGKVAYRENARGSTSVRMWTVVAGTLGELGQLAENPPSFARKSLRLKEA